MANPDPLYLSLLGTAESFRTSTPPNIKLCVQCLQGVLNCKPPPRIESRTHLQIGIILLNFTENFDTARNHLEKAVSQQKSSVTVRPTRDKCLILFSFKLIMGFYCLCSTASVSKARADFLISQSESVSLSVKYYNYNLHIYIVYLLYYIIYVTHINCMFLLLL